MKTSLIIFGLVSVLVTSATRASASINCQKDLEPSNELNIPEYKIMTATPSLLRKWSENQEPMLQHMNAPIDFRPPDRTIFDNRRGYYLPEQLRFRSAKLIRMYRGLNLLTGENFNAKSERLGLPIWMAPDFEHAKLYAAEWTNRGESGTRAIILEMLIPQFMIYWKEDPRDEEAEAFVMDSDIRTLDSFVVKIHEVSVEKSEYREPEFRWDEPAWPSWPKY